jgi:hypothetical protein
MRKFVGIVLGLVAVFNGLGILADDSCNSVSFGGQGGGRVLVATCFTDSEGTIPGSAAGIGLLFLGAAVAVVFAKWR